MDTYRYKAINEVGNTVSGTLEAESGQNASAMLASRDLIPLQVTEENGDQSDTLWNRIKALTGGVKTRDLILFTKQFRSMLNAGVPMTRSMQVLEAQTERKVLKQAIKAISANVSQGSPYRMRLKNTPKYFHISTAAWCWQVKSAVMCPVFWSG